MSAAGREGGLFGAPRVAVAGEFRTSLGGADSRVCQAIGTSIDVRRIFASTSPVGWLHLLREGGRALGPGGCEALHLLDPRLAPAAVLLRRKHSVPLTVTLIERPRGYGRVTRAALRGVDAAFLHADETSRFELRAPVVHAPLLAPIVASPAQGAFDAMSRLLRGVAAGRLIVAVPWPRDEQLLRWFRDAVAPLLRGSPVCLLLGAPSRRRARLLAGAMGMRGDIVAHCGRLTQDVVAAAARCVDAFVAVGDAREASMTDLLLATTASAAPTVVANGVGANAMLHELNGIVAAPDAMGLVAAINGVLALPPVQRHYLGQTFASYTLRRWNAEAATAVYVERLRALVGRPEIPDLLRAA